MNKLIITLSILAIIVPLGIISYQIYDNNRRIKSVNNSAILTEVFIKANKDKKPHDLWFFNCRPTQYYQAQGDWDRSLEQYISESNNWNWKDVSNELNNEGKLQIKGIKNLINNSEITFSLIINKQQAILSELKTEESLCFDIQDIKGR